MFATVLTHLRQLVRRALVTVRTRVSQRMKSAAPALVGGLIADLVRSRQEFILENALLCQLLIVLHRTAKRLRLTAIDRGLLVLLASRLRTWANALVITQPETILHWHRQGFRLFWRRKSRSAARAPRTPAETIPLIRQLVADNQLWGAERIRGELLKLDIRGSKRTIQKYMYQARSPRPPGQTWATFLRNHASEIWACDFLQVTDLLFRPLLAFFLVELGSRRVVHVGVMRTPTDEWVTQRLREATPYEERRHFLIRDHDGKYGPQFDRLAAASGIEMLRTAIAAPRSNAIIERFLGSVRRECLDHLLILTEARLRRALRTYAAYFNRARPHQGLGQREHGGVVAILVLGGLHHEYRRVA